MKPGDSRFIDKPSGYVLDEHDNVIAHTFQCPHCGSHFIPPASIMAGDKIRGYCAKCKKRTCGRPPCAICIPFKAKLDLVDGGNVSDAAQLRLRRKYQEDLDELAKRNQPIL